MSKIDWTKPLEHVDGTPLRLAIAGKETAINTPNPDAQGDYYLVREDGKIFTVEQRGAQAIEDILIVRPNGASWRNEYGRILVRNRAESQWGAEIEVNGVRPDWLRVTDKVDVRTSGGWIYSRNGASDVPPEDWAWTHHDGSPCIRAIRLPADHPYYLATSKGFTYWPGGDAAPGDWDGGTTLARDGNMFDSIYRWDWRDGETYSYGATDVIGYRRKPEFGKVHTDGSRSGGQPLPVAEQPEGDVVTIARMTPEQWGEQWPGYDFRTLAGLGLVRDETRAERFTRVTGFRVTPDVEAALEWERG